MRRVRRQQRSDDVLAQERARLDELLAAEYRERTTELKRALAVARSDLVSARTEEARRLDEERRSDFAEREQRAAAEHSMRLMQVQKRVEDRLTAWAHDL